MSLNLVELGVSLIPGIYEDLRFSLCELPEPDDALTR